MLTPTKFDLVRSMPKPNVRVPREEVLTTRKIGVDLSDTKPKKPTHPVGKKQHKPQWTCRLCDGVGRTRRLVPLKRLDESGLVIVWTPCYTTEGTDFQRAGCFSGKRWAG